MTIKELIKYGLRNSPLVCSLSAIKISAQVQSPHKADRALSKLKFLFHLNSQRNLVTLRKYVIHIIFSIIIKLV